MLIFDLGFGNLRRLAQAGLDPADVTDVFLSHMHPDHCGDVPALLFLFRYDRKPRSGRLRIWGPQGVKKWLACLEQAWKPWISPRGYRLEVRVLANGSTAKFSRWSMEALAVNHPTPSLAYRLSYKGKSLVYSGDTGFCPKLADFASNCDLFLLEASLPAGGQYPFHMTVAQAVATAKASLCRKAVYTHVTPASAVQLRRKRLTVARDLMRVRI